MPWNAKPAALWQTASRGHPAGRPRRRWSRLAAAAVVLLACGLIYLLRPGGPVISRFTGCEADASGDAVSLNPGQAGIAAIIAGVASRRALPARAVAIAYAAAMQESKLTNLHYGDLDSVGVFQQRPSQGWGTVRQIENPVYATGRFFDALTAVPDYLQLPIEVAAQDVQHSADGSAYGQYAAAGTTLAAGFTGAVPHAVWCSYADPPAPPDLAAASSAMTSTFGLQAQPADGGRAMTMLPSTASQGWTVAAWLVSHASSYGIRTVRYQGYQWDGFTGSGRWRTEPARARTPGGTDSVQFG